MKLYELKAIIDMLSDDCEVTVRPPEKEENRNPIGFAATDSEENQIQEDQLLKLKGEK